MIYIAGDTHGWIDYWKIIRLDRNSFTGCSLGKSDYLIVLGDFGLLWDKSDSHKRLFQEWLSKPYTVLFIDGNHENFPVINSYPVKIWNGGKVHDINGIFHLMRGQVYNIEGKSFFTMGGGDSIDKMKRTPDVSWWQEELPSFQEYDEGLTNLESYNNTVDYILTHSCSNMMFHKLSTSAKFFQIYSAINDYFDEIEKKVRFKHWYFGHYHIDADLDGTHTAMYDKIIKIK